MQNTFFEMEPDMADDVLAEAIISCFKDGYSPGHEAGSGLWCNSKRWPKPAEALVKMLEAGIDPNTPSPGT